MNQQSRNQFVGHRRTHELALLHLLSEQMNLDTD